MTGFWLILWAIVTLILLWFIIRREAWDERGRNIWSISEGLSYPVLVGGLMVVFMITPFTHINYTTYRTTVQIIVIIGLTVQAATVLWQRKRL